MSVGQGTVRQRLIGIARRSGALRSRDLKKHGIPREYLRRLRADGVLRRVARGVYRLADYPVTEHATLVEAVKRVPDGVICLLSALLFHDIGTQLPREVWIAIDRKGWKPRVSDTPIHVVRFSGAALLEGVEEHRIEGVRVSVYSPEKTVADCFKYRNKIGLDVAIEALKDCRERHHCSANELWRFAKIDRVSKVMRPYLEAIA